LLPIKISLLTVCYNSAATIEKTIQSVAQQSHDAIEYIIIDGGSTDDTLAIIERYPQVVSRWISEPDKGLYDAMNKGIALATGDLVGILNSDDTFYADEVLAQVAHFHQTHDIEASVGNIVQHQASGKIIRLYSAKNWTPQKLRIGFMPPHPSIFFKRELFNYYGNYQLDFVIGADYELITRFFLKQHIRWAYSGITTTAMLVGGLSSSGSSSYQLISKEIQLALQRNGMTYSPLKIQFRWIWKLMGFLKK
jgi:glycosyltransferase involved in cell wall biosynthesis